MAKKESRELPPDFDINLPSDKPVELGDYLDEEAGRSASDAQKRLDTPGPATAAQTMPAAAAFAPMSAPSSYHRGIRFNASILTDSIQADSIEVTAILL